MLEIAYPPSRDSVAYLELVAGTHEIEPIYESYLLLVHALQEQNVLSRRLSLSSAITRFVSSFLSSEDANQLKINMAVTAEKRGIDAAVVAVRNKCSHGRLPPVAVLERTAHICLRWLCEEFKANRKADRPASEYEVCRKALIEHRDLQEFLQLCDRQHDILVISQIIARVALQTPAERLEKIRSASLSLLDDDPFSVIKRGLQMLYQHAKLPILAYLVGERVTGLESISKLETLKCTAQLRTALSFPADDDWVPAAAEQEEELCGAQPTGDQVIKRWLGGE